MLGEVVGFAVLPGRPKGEYTAMRSTELAR